jgi:hypothetical protein
MTTKDTPITLTAARRLAADTARAEAIARADAEGRIQRGRIPFRVTKPIRPIIRHRASERELLERIRALWTADIALAKEEAAQIATRRAALRAELLAGHEPEAVA